jgi:hypothetical protein
MFEENKVSQLSFSAAGESYEQSPAVNLIKAKTKKEPIYLS